MLHPLNYDIVLLFFMNLFFLSKMYIGYLSIIVMFWCCEAFSVGGSVGGASHARQQPMRTLELH